MNTPDPAELEKPVFGPSDVDIPFSLFIVDNGLRLIVHEDHKAPIVAVNVWYHVGSKNEKPGKSGLAHLFEHLMFNGSEHFNDDYFQALMAIGATDINGTTSHDRTNYFQNVPVAALDRVLWLESDRMGHLLGALDQAKLDEQRGVVQNEKRQRENVPYGLEQELLTTEMFPPGHPYSWTVIGSMEDLDGTTVEDCHNWFKAYYGAANAVLVVAGDVQPEDVLARVKRYFGHIAPGPAITRPELNIPLREHETRMSFQDRVPEARVTMVWNTAQLGTEDDALLDLAASVLSQGKTARLFRDLVFDKQIATGASAGQWSREIAGNFIVSANAKPGQSIEGLEREVNKILQDFIEHGPREDELARVKASYFAAFTKGLERIGGFGGKSDVLASSAVYGRSPDAYKIFNQYIAAATPEKVRRTCQQWLTRGRFTLVCHPLRDLKHDAPVEDRSAMPALGEIRAGRFPTLQRATLDNGLELVLASRPGSDTVAMQAVFKRGFASDGDIPGLASLAMSLMDEGTANMDALEISERLQLLGASLSSSAGLDHSEVRMKTLKQTLAPSVALFADVMLSPAFPEDQLERLKKEQHDAIQREKVTPMSMALRVVPRILFGTGHRYAQPLTGSGYESSVAAIAREDVLKFHRETIRPDNCVLIVAGDLTMDEVIDKIGNQLQTWERGSVVSKPHVSGETETAGSLFFLNRPGSLQSIVIGAYLVDAFDPNLLISTDLMNDVLGGQFTSRVNMNLREDKHWTYGARSLIVHTEERRPLLVYASVQMDKTLDTIREIRGEFTRIIGDEPVTQEEFEKNQANTIMGLPGQWETNGAVANAINYLIKLGLPDNYYDSYAHNLQSLTVDEVRTAAQQIIRPDELCWFVVGDKSMVYEQLKDGAFRSIVEIESKG